VAIQKKKPVPRGSHRMPSGKIMKNSAMKKSKKSLRKSKKY
jgi:hypothetical protein